jgi:hypothetical protein
LDGRTRRRRTFSTTTRSVAVVRKPVAAVDRHVDRPQTRSSQCAFQNLHRVKLGPTYKHLALVPTNGPIISVLPHGNTVTCTPARTISYLGMMPPMPKGIDDTRRRCLTRRQCISNLQYWPQYQDVKITQRWQCNVPLPISSTIKTATCRLRWK